MRILRYAIPMLLVVVGVGFAMRAVVTRAHDSQVAELKAGYGAQLAAAARNSSDDLDDLSDVLHLTGELMASGGGPHEHERELRAILEAVGQVRVIATYAPDGVEELYLPDHRAPPEFSSPTYRDAAARTAARALADASGRVVVSTAIQGATSGWQRVLASRFGGGGKSLGAVAILVDMEPIFAGLRVLGTRADTDLLVLGPNLKVARTSSQVLEAAYEARDRLAAPEFQAAVRELAGRQSGTRVLSPSESLALGLSPAERILAYLPVPMKNGPAWSVAIFVSTAVIRDTEARLVTQLWIGAIIGLLALAAIGANVLTASRRATALAESRRHAEELAQINARIQRILDHIPAGVIALGPDRRLSAANRVLRDREPALAPGAELKAALPRASAESTERLLDLLARAEEADRAQTLAGEALTLFGEEGHYAVHAVPVQRGDPSVRSILVVEDLSSLRALQSQLIQAEKMATVGVLAAGIAHEIGTPLGVVRGRAEYVLNKLGTEHPQARNVEVIVDQIDHVSRTIRQLLDFARTKPAPAQPVAVVPMLRTVRDLLAIEAQRRKISLDVAAEEGVPPVAADPDQLQQVLINLALNACDACSEGGQVVLGAESEKGALRPDSMVRLVVLDTGAGIPPEDLHRVFDPFFTTKKRGQGTGLGLTIVSEIVRNHGGRIEVESPPGQGTRVTLHWPAAAPAAREAHHAA